jgi:hypothetical protein
MAAHTKNRRERGGIVSVTLIRQRERKRKKERKKEKGVSC